MKKIKTVLALAITTIASTTLYAQQQANAETAKPAVSTIPVAQQTAPAAATVTSEFTGGTHQKATQQTTPQAKPADEKNEEMAKPVQVSAKNALPVPEIVTEKRSDAKKPVPMIPAENTNLAPTAPVKRATKPVPEQQQ